MLKNPPDVVQAIKETKKHFGLAKIFPWEKYGNGVQNNILKISLCTPGASCNTAAQNPPKSFFGTISGYMRFSKTISNKSCSIRNSLFRYIYNVQIRSIL